MPTNTQMISKGKGLDISAPVESKPVSWEEFFREDASKVVPDDFMTDADRRQGQQHRDPFQNIKP
ncbi:hypothetical protein GTP58_20525 [Duganella sp. CY15W]|uniref:hypothetical protein n=1 Tax=Duganella sp. CY15W TaxID=2692172 RepID=UPI001371E61D|nr:hypothetical protein [Duganella sp. CY15W]MYM30723.1 hypothetical protein [Duganella sp. CY15W]